MLNNVECIEMRWITEFASFKFLPKLSLMLENWEKYLRIM